MSMNAPLATFPASTCGVSPGDNAGTATVASSPSLSSRGFAEGMQSALAATVGQTDETTTQAGNISPASTPSTRTANASAVSLPWIKNARDRGNRLPPIQPAAGPAAGPAAEPGVEPGGPEPGARPGPATAVTARVSKSSKTSLQSSSIVAGSPARGAGAKTGRGTAAAESAIATPAAQGDIPVPVPPELTAQLEPPNRRVLPNQPVLSNQPVLPHQPVLPNQKVQPDLGVQRNLDSEIILAAGNGHGAPVSVYPSPNDGIPQSAQIQPELQIAVDDPTGAVPNAASITAHPHPIAAAPETPAVASSITPLVVAHASGTADAANPQSQSPGSMRDSNPVRGVEPVSSTSRTSRPALRASEGTAAGESIPLHSQLQGAMATAPPLRDADIADKGFLRPSPDSDVPASGSRDTFAALDGATSGPETTWIHAGAHHAEAGFLDPSLGWVSVRADGTAAGVHAALVPGSADAAAALGNHLAGLNAFMSERHGGAATVSLASPETGNSHLASSYSGDAGPSNSHSGGAMDRRQDQQQYPDQVAPFARDPRSSSEPRNHPSVASPNVASPSAASLVSVLQPVSNSLEPYRAGAYLSVMA